MTETHKQFIENVIDQVRTDDDVVGLAVGGSWITNEIDEYSDLDLVLVTKTKISTEVETMTAYARKFGNLLNGFTGEHVGESRLLICLYDTPLLHVDIKFVTPDEFSIRVEDPMVVWERNGTLTSIIKHSKAEYPYPDYQWIEDRFWIWTHYACLKIGRGELFEALDFCSFMRVNVIAPLLQISNGKLPKALRKVEINLSSRDLSRLKQTIASHDKDSIIKSLEAIIAIYTDLRKQLFPKNIHLRSDTERSSLQYLESMKPPTPPQTPPHPQTHSHTHSHTQNDFLSVFQNWHGFG